MMRGMFAAISGLKVHQTMLDVAANDIANVNTVGYRAGRVSFKDALAQNQRGASSPSTALGGTNPVQIGLGVQLGSIDSVMSPGAIQTTGNPLDMAVQGSGWFRVSDGAVGASGSSTYYTRADNFSIDSSGNLVTQDGMYVVGFAQTSAGPPPVFGTTDTAITVPTGAKSVSVGQDGVVSYVSAAGTTTTLAQVTLAKFPNDAGLQRVSGNRFAASNNSGTATVGFPGDTTTGVGTLASGGVEMSNVDLAQEFTSIIVAQRGFQANSRVISSADQILQDLVNIGR
jgi:flagellar hook protein FlgE